MPFLARLSVKTAFLWLLAWLALEAVHAAGALHPLTPLLRATEPSLLHLFLVGWLLQLVFGISYWMFPRFSRQDPHFSEGLAWTTWTGLNLGLVLRLTAEAPLSLRPNHTFWGSLLVAGGLLQLIAVLAFVANTWPRVRRKAGR